MQVDEVVEGVVQAAGIVMHCGEEYRLVRCSAEQTDSAWANRHPLGASSLAPGPKGASKGLLTAVLFVQEFGGDQGVLCWENR